jgi:hypothetical protein
MTTDLKEIHFATATLAGVAGAQGRWPYRLWLPDGLGKGMTLARTLYVYPDGVSLPHLDFIRFELQSAEGKKFALCQGFEFTVNAIYPNAPIDAKGAELVQGREAIWVSAYPGQESRMIDGRPVPRSWTHDFAGVAWRFVVEQDVPAFVNLQSRKLSVRDLLAIAATVSQT